MAQFRVGMRVRITVSPEQVGFRFNGTETVITATMPDGDFGPRWRTAATDSNAQSMGVYEYCLTPILPPDDAADQFIARLKKLGSEPVNDAPKVTEREGK